MKPILNTGLALRRPAESAYAMLRRFVIANPTIRYGVIRQAALALSVQPVRRPNIGSHLARLALHVNNDHCLRYAIEPLSADALDSVHAAKHLDELTIRRNCPRCSAMAYHSPIFELPWLLQCPLHGDRLQLRCPDCGNSWPSGAQLWKRQCHTCGGRLCLRDLIAAGAFDSTLNFEPLHALYDTLCAARQWAEYTLVAFDTRYPEPQVVARRYPIPPANPWFPAMAVRVCPAAPVTALRQIVPLERCFFFRFTEQPGNAMSRDCNSLSPMTDWMWQCRARATRKIRAAIACSAGPNHRLQRISGVFPSAGSVGCAYCTAFSIWHSLTDSNGFDPGYSRHFLGAQLYRNIDKVLAAPHPWDVLTRRRNETDGVLWRQPEDCFALPSRARQLLYVIDLWTTFVNIFRYIEFYYAESIRSAFRYPSLTPPDDADPRQSRPQALAFWLDDTAAFCLLVPRSLLVRRLPTALAEEWVKRCTDAGSHNLQHDMRGLI